jgi:hypothetical protein
MNWIIPSLVIALFTTQYGSTRTHLGLHVATLVFVIVTAAVATSNVGAALTTVKPGLALLWTGAIISMFSILSKVELVMSYL